MPIPIFTDRSVWDTVGYPDFHARDIQDSLGTYHLPTSGSYGQVLTWDGSKWVPQTPTSGSSGGDDVTLDADADVLLDITGQEIGLDVQAANKIFAGPTTGADNEPTFRALVAADLGTGTPDGTKFLRDDLTWQTVSPGASGYYEPVAIGIESPELVFLDGDVVMIGPI